MFNPLDKHNQGERLFDTVKAFFEKGTMAMKPDTTLDATLNAIFNSTSYKHIQRYPRLRVSCRYQGGKSNNAIHLCRLRMILFHPSAYQRPGDGKR